ncbi:hypothetical protein AD998_15395 [bacterium 336/3]|nr:hypothetical protein AD998_15395 [bacterium 336/3]
MEEKYLYLPEAQAESYWDLDTNNWLESLGNIKSVNIFVGANNSGKSRLMRLLLSKNKYNILPNKNTVINFKKLSTNTNIISRHIRFKDDIINRLNNFNTENKDTFQRDIDSIINIFKGYNEYEIVEKTLKDVKHIEYLSLPQIIYIPILRSALTFYRNDFGQNPQIYSDNIYEKTIWELYDFASKVPEKNKFEVFTGKNLYEQIKKELLSPRNTRDNFRAFEKFIGDVFFNEKIEIGVIDSQEDKKRHIRVYFEKDDDKNIQDLGDGIQTIIILTYKLFMAEKGAWIFIEEPELNLHPAYQRIFLELITKRSEITEKELTIFFTTHSNHLLDITITQNSKISIFVFERDKRNGENVSLIRNVSATDLQTLDTLGVHNSSVFMANCSIWVEGITDRIYIRNYLKAYIKHCQENTNKEFEKEYKEDLHFAFFEYAGSNLEHYNFDNSETENIQAKFITNRVFVIADRDENKERKHTKFKAQLKNNYQVLKVKEIENLLKGSFLKEKLPKLFSSIKANDISSMDFKEQEYKNTFLRYYLIKKLQVLENRPEELKLEFKKVKNSKIKQEKQETFSQYYKQKLANLTNNITWDEMSKEAQELTKKIYNFIKANNKTKA